MDMVREETQSARVAAILEGKIRNGDIKPGSKLWGMRGMCDMFDVSRTVVRSAVKLLEEKQLLITEPRRGTYVNPQVLSLDKIELGALTFRSEHTESYLEKALNLTNSSSYCRDFNLTLRCIGEDILNFDTFVNEVNNYRNSHCRMLVLGSSYLNRERLEVLNSCGIPFLVLGELAHELPEFPFQQIYERFLHKGRFVAEFLARSACRSAAYIAFPPGMLEYEEEYCRLLREYMAAAGKPFHVEYLKFAPEHDVNSSRKVAAALGAMLKSGIRPDIVHISDIVEYGELVATAHQFGLRVPEEINFLVYRNPSEAFHSFGIQEIITDYSSFANAAFLRMRDIYAHPERILSLDFSDLVQFRIRTVNFMQP